MRFELVRRGLLLVLSAPSGGGKSAVLREMLKRDPHLRYSVSFTSRQPRVGEVNGQDYHFVNIEEFRAMIQRDEFYEYAEVHGNMYGTSAKVVEECMSRRLDVTMDIDVQGGLNIKRRVPDSVLVFLMPPSMDILEKRLRSRASDKEEQIQLRMTNAYREIDQWKHYDYVVVNQDFDTTVQRVQDILNAERQRASRHQISKIPTT